MQLYGVVFKQNPIHVIGANILYSLSLIFRISLIYIHDSFRIISEFSVFIKLKKSCLLLPCLYQGERRFCRIASNLKQLKNTWNSSSKRNSNQMTDGSVNAHLRPGIYTNNLSRHMAKSTICLGENKGADQLRSNCEADQRLCFRYSDSTVPCLLKSEISRF